MITSTHFSCASIAGVVLSSPAESRLVAKFLRLFDGRRLASDSAFPLCEPTKTLRLGLEPLYCSVPAGADGWQNMPARKPFSHARWDGVNGALSGIKGTDWHSIAIVPRKSGSCSLRETRPTAKKALQATPLQVLYFLIALSFIRRRGPAFLDAVTAWKLDELSPRLRFTRSILTCSSRVGSP